MRKVGIKQLRNLKTEAFKKQPFLLCSDSKPVALIVPTGDLSEQEIVTPKVTTEEPSQRRFLKSRCQFFLRLKGC